MNRASRGARGGLVIAALAMLWSTAMACGGSGSSSSTGTGGGGGSAGAGVCPGASPPPDGYPVCRSDADCTQFGFCVSAPIGGCGACMGAEHACTTDPDCGSPTLVCEPYVLTGPCVCGPPDGTQCITRCPDQPCAADAQCSASGHCTPTPCDQGYMCPSDRACSPGGAMPDVHGCVPKSCTAGFQCTPDRHCDPNVAAADVHGCAPTLCTMGFACATGFECAPGPSSDPHGCKVIPCSKGNTCPVNYDCDPALSGQGCAQRACVKDGDCDCGACVMGKCQPRLWICDSPPS